MKHKKTALKLKKIYIKKYQKVTTDSRNKSRITKTTTIVPINVNSR